MRDKMDPLKNKTAVGDVQAEQAGETTAAQESENYSLNDDRRVKVLSPGASLASAVGVLVPVGALVAKRFFRNGLAVTGLTILIIMFVFSFLGAIISPYTEDELFYRQEMQRKDYAGVTQNTEFRYMAADAAKFTGVVQAQAFLAYQKKATTFTYREVVYTLTEEGQDMFSVAQDGQLIGIGFKDTVTSSVDNAKFSFDFTYQALKAYVSGQSSFTVGDKTYTLTEDANVLENGSEIAFISRYVMQPILPDVFLSREFRAAVEKAIDAEEDSFVYVDEAGKENAIDLEYNAAKMMWTVLQDQSTRVLDKYAAPSAAHWLGTDRNGMDMMTRLMYGGRVSLVIGFIVVIIETVVGVIMGGLSGYFGGWVDNTMRMLYLMLILGFLGWPGIARLVRGQILSLREQEFMTATEACGIRVSRRIFRHLIPNVIPQLIVFCTMGLGSTIITEATLSFLGLGVRFPFASWGNIINDVNNTYVLTTYGFVWIPAGICLLVTVLAFNLVGDGLRNAFDPKMKR